jgi:hypothetical protein
LKNIYFVSALLIVVVASLALNVWLLTQKSAETKTAVDHRSNEQVVRDMLIYEASYAGLSLDQATKKAESDNLLPRIGSRGGEPVGHLDLRITPVGSVVAYFDLTGPKENETIQGVDFWGEVSHFEYLDILRQKGQSAANDYAKEHNLH